MISNALNMMLLIRAIQIPAAAAGRLHDEDGDAPTNEESGAEEEAAAPAGGQERTLGHRCELGCYYCGRTVSSRFRRWRNSAVAWIREIIKPKRPDSDQICNICYCKLMSCHPSTTIHEVRPSI